MSPEYVWVRISAKVIFTEEIRIKEEALRTKPMLKDLFSEATNPIFTMFFLTEGTATIYDYSGNNQKSYTF